MFALRLPAFACALILGVVSCGGAADVRRITYPPDFHYVEGKEIRSVMQAMAADVSALDRVLRVEPPAQPDKARVIELLDSLNSTAAQLTADGAGTNHPVISDHIHELKRDLEHARAAAAREPPNYFFAGAVTGSCMYCHGQSAR